MDIAKILTFGGYNCTVRGDRSYSENIDINTIDYDIENNLKLTNDEFHRLASEYFYDLKSKEYIDKRQREYKPFAEQLDMIYWDKVNNTNEWEEHINSVKMKFKKD